jgi:hypothetical protein
MKQGIISLPNDEKGGQAAMSNQMKYGIIGILVLGAAAGAYFFLL